jgi:hypothetical protein
LVVTIVTALAAMITFAAATQGYFISKSRLWETAALLLIAFTLFRPGFWLDQIEPPYRLEEPARIVEVAGSAAADGDIRMMVEGEDLSSGEMVSKTVVLPLGPAGDGAERLMEHAGIEVRDEDGKVLIDNITFGGPAEQAKLDFDWQITGIEVEADRMPKQLFYIPAILLLAAVYMLQRRRRQAHEAAEAATD